MGEELGAAQFRPDNILLLSELGDFRFVVLNLLFQNFDLAGLIRLLFGGSQQFVRLFNSLSKNFKAFLGFLVHARTVLGKRKNEPHQWCDPLFIR